MRTPGGETLCTAGDSRLPAASLVNSGGESLFRPDSPSPQPRCTIELLLRMDTPLSSGQGCQISTVGMSMGLWPARGGGASSLKVARTTCICHWACFCPCSRREGVGFSEAQYQYFSNLPNIIFPPNLIFGLILSSIFFNLV